MKNSRNLIKKEDIILKNGEIDTVYTYNDYNVDKKGNKKEYLHVKHYVHSPLNKEINRYTNINQDLRALRKLHAETVIFYKKNTDFASYSPSKYMEMSDDDYKKQIIMYTVQKINGEEAIKMYFENIAKDLFYLSKLKQEYPKEYKMLKEILKIYDLKNQLEELKEYEKV